MNKPTECIVVGGGSSIKQAPEALLRAVLASKFTILTNYSFKHFNGTFLAFMDHNFYKPTPDRGNPDIYGELKQLPLIIGINQDNVADYKLDNTILLDQKYYECLTGVFALKLATMIMEKGNIYLLGFDWNRRIGLPERDPNYNPNSDLQIHYYDDIKHRGSGYVGYYENHNPDKTFNKFTNNLNFKIYNVSLDSNITCFEKISYTQMFNILTKENINQEELRTYIRGEIK